MNGDKTGSERFFLGCLLIIGLTLAVAADDWLTDPQNKIKIWNPQPRLSAEWSGGAKDGCADGLGVMKWFEDGVLKERFEGSYAKGRPEGRCRFEVYDSKGAVTLSGEGDFKDGAMSGKGKIVGKDGEKYEGNFRFGVFQGEGVQTLPDGKVLKGRFENGKFVGE